MEILQVSEQEIQENTNLQQGEVKEQVKLLTMNRDWTKEERLRYIAYRDKQNDYVVSRPKKVNKGYNNKSNKYKKEKTTKEVKSKPKKSSGREKLGDGRTTDTHHILAKSRIGSNNRVNLKEFNMKKHQALHTLFGNAYPHEMLNQILEFCEQVLHPQTKEMIVEEIQQIVEYYLKYDEFYNPLAIKQG